MGVVVFLVLFAALVLFLLVRIVIGVFRWFFNV